MKIALCIILALVFLALVGLIIREIRRIRKISAEEKCGCDKQKCLNQRRTW